MMNSYDTLMDAINRGAQTGAADLAQSVGLTDDALRAIMAFGLTLRGSRNGRLYLSDEQTTWSAVPDDINQASTLIMPRYEAGEYASDDPEEPLSAQARAYGAWCSAMCTGSEDYRIYE